MDNYRAPTVKSLKWFRISREKWFVPVAYGLSLIVSELLLSNFNWLKGALGKVHCSKLARQQKRMAKMGLKASIFVFCQLYAISKLPEEENAIMRLNLTPLGLLFSHFNFVHFCWWSNFALVNFGWLLKTVTKGESLRC